MSGQEVEEWIQHRKVEVDDKVYVWMLHGLVNLYDIFAIVWTNEDTLNAVKADFLEIKNPRKRYYQHFMVGFFEDRFMATLKKVPEVLMLVASTEKLKKDVEKFLSKAVWRLSIHRASEENKLFEKVDKFHTAIMVAAKLLEEMDSKDRLYAEYKGSKEITDIVENYALKHKK